MRTTLKFTESEMMEILLLANSRNLELDKDGKVLAGMTAGLVTEALEAFRNPPQPQYASPPSYPTPTQPEKGASDVKGA